MRVSVFVLVDGFLRYGVFWFCFTREFAAKISRATVTFHIIFAAGGCMPPKSKLFSPRAWKEVQLFDFWSTSGLPIPLTPAKNLWLVVHQLSPSSCLCCSVSRLKLRFLLVIVNSPVLVRINSLSHKLLIQPHKNQHVCTHWYRRNWFPPMLPAGHQIKQPGARNCGELPVRVWLPGPPWRANACQVGRGMGQQLGNSLLDLQWMIGMILNHSERLEEHLLLLKHEQCLIRVLFVRYLRPCKFIFTIISLNTLVKLQLWCEPTMTAGCWVARTAFQNLVQP